ncbi:MAG: hypothetical protein JXR70_15950 [Spirochaetales bacterium]|nr:hypothetical protein [Spirochaetales bacterium]
MSIEDNKLELKKDQVFTVRIYFIEAIELISVVVNTLIKLEFETYSISMAESQFLIPVLKRSLRNIIFICVNTAREAEHWLEYIDKLDKLGDVNVQVGIFTYNNISDKLKLAFLERRAAVIRYSDLQENTLNVIKKILVYFEAKGQRKFVRAKASGISEAFFTVKNLEEAVRGDILETSAAAFSCRIPQAFRVYFNKGDSFDQVLLVLRGIRVRVSAQVLGFDQKAPDVFIFKLCTAKIEDNKLIYVDGLLPEVKAKVHTYIRMCLRSQIASELEAYSMKDKAAAAEDKKED